MSQTNDSATSVLDSFFLKLGTVLSLTKDALLADFIGGFPSYVPPDKFFNSSIAHIF